MITIANAKVCKCCGTMVKVTKRVCPSCKVPALWRAPTPAECDAVNAKNAKLEATLQELMNGNRGMGDQRKISWNCEQLR